MSSTLKTVGIVGAAALVLGYLAGFLPERGRRMAAETQAASHQAEVASIRQELTSIEGRSRVSVLLGRALMLKDLAVGSDYGRAQQVSSEFFDAIRSEATATQDAARRAVLMSVLSRRDVVTAALAKAEPAVVSTLTMVERDLRKALDYPVAESGTESARVGSLSRDVGKAAAPDYVAADQDGLDPHDGLDPSAVPA